MILDKIAVQRRVQLEKEKALCPQAKKLAEKMDNECRDFAHSILSKKEGRTVPSIIAEVKKASPSKGLISKNFMPVETALTYEKCGAAAISVLTEEAHFMGSNNYLQAVSQNVNIPVLRKDFIIDEFQIYHARVLGADAVLLIAAMLNTDTLREYIKIAHSLSLQCLCEAHSEEEAESIMKAGAVIAGINNRDLKTFHVDLKATERAMKITAHAEVKISESGIKYFEDMKRVAEYGADGVLVGEAFMASDNIEREFTLLRGEA